MAIVTTDKAPTSTNTAPAATGGGTSTDKLNNVSQNYTDFLKLLTTQLKNQDPSAPTDTNQLTQQIATLSQVEQQISTNKNLEKLVSMYSATQYNSVVSYIGKRIEAEGNVSALTTGKVNFAYNLQSSASTVDLTIKDKSGNTVRNITLTGIKGAGVNNYVWDGQDNQGNQMSSGDYTITVSAKSNTGETVTAIGGTGTLKNGTPEYVYYLASEANNVAITIKDSSGAVVRKDTTSGTKLAGRNEYTWDGKDNNGNTMPAGNYTIEVSATDAAGKDIVSKTYMTGIVTSVDSVNGGAYLSIGDISVPLEKVTSIRPGSQQG